MGDNRKAEENISQAVESLQKLGDYYPISVYLTFMADIYQEKGDDSTAIRFALRSLQLAKTHFLKDQISDANFKLSALYETRGDFPEALKYFKDHVAYRDSVSNIASVEHMANQRADFEVSQKQLEVDLLNVQKRNQALVVLTISIALFLIGLLAVELYRRNKLISKTNSIIEEERNRSDQLLLNILPEETAKELKTNGRVKAKKFDSVTVLFSDFKNFTPFAEASTPEEIVETVDYYFSKFDRIMEKYGLEKIKTLGDAYMAAGGLSFDTDDHAAKMAKAAIDMIDFVQKTMSDEAASVARFEIRIGINTGAVVAGVVGIKKFAYDIWGDTVNIASLMESNSISGRLNISESTYQLIKEKFNCTYRGEFAIKNRGTMKMYFVDGMKEKVV